MLNIGLCPGVSFEITDRWSAEFSIGFLGYLKEPEKKAALAKKFGEMSHVKNYESEPNNIISCWLIIVFWTIIYAAAAVIALEFIDKDKR